MVRRDRAGPQQFVGVVRLVLTNPDDPSSPFPIEQPRDREALVPAARTGSPLRMTPRARLRAPAAAANSAVNTISGSMRPLLAAAKGLAGTNDTRKSTMPNRIPSSPPANPYHE